MTRIEFTLPRPYFAAGHYNPKIRAAIKQWADQHNITVDEYRISATADYKMYLEFDDDKYLTLWALSWNKPDLPNWSMIPV